MKILFLTANPKEMRRLDLNREAQAIKHILSPNNFEFKQEWIVSPDILQSILSDTKPNLVHFSGHGIRESGLVFVDQAGNPAPATGDALANLFALIPSVKCVLLNSCYTEVQAKVIAQYVDYVIGMKDEVLDRAAIAFSEGFYYALNRRETIERAFLFGQNKIQFLYDSSMVDSRTYNPRKGIPQSFTEDKYVTNMPENLKPILLKKDSTTITKTTNVTSDQEAITVEIREHLANSSLAEHDILKTKLLAIEYGIPISEFDNILQAELVKRKLRQEEYRAVLQEKVKQGYPFHSHVEQELQELQQSLNLTDAEEKEVSHKILQQAKKQANLPEENKQKRNKFTLEININFGW